MADTIDTAAPHLGFSAYGLDRADHLRKDAAALAALRARPDAQVAVFQKLRAFVRGDANGTAPALLPASALDGLDASPIVFVGMQGEAPIFAAALAEEDAPDALSGLDPEARFEEMRGLALLLSPDDLAALGTARSLLAWHARHGFCANCGAATAPSDGGWKRICGSCKAEHFPRVDPVAIMAITRGEHLLLGRQAGWPPRYFSCLAGFIEPGETIEQGAQREAFEEAGVRIGPVRYAFSQPWPFPSSLMIGVYSETADETLNVDPKELETARWFSRDEVRAMLAGDHPEARQPPPFTIAHHLMRAWALGEDGA